MSGVRVVYQGLYGLAFLVGAGGVPWLARRSRRIRDGIPDFLGGLASPPAGPLVWVHGVSLGESLVALPLMQALKKACPGGRIGFTTTHPDVLATVRKKGLADVSGYFPLDFRPLMRRAFERWRPRLILVSETDFWPCFTGLARERGIPLVLVNGRISEKLCRFYASIPPLGREVFGGFTRLLVQSPGDAERLSAMGADPRKIEITGNLKVDLVPAVNPGLLAPFQAWKGTGRVVVFGSLHPSEFAGLLPVFERLRERGIRLLVAPRNVAHAEEWEKVLRGRGLAVVRRSAWCLVGGPSGAPESGGLGRPAVDSADGPPTCREGQPDGASKNVASGCRQPDILLLDTVGELASLYALGDAAFVGGTLDPAVGGHNPLEPIHLGVPTVIGPHARNVADLVEALTAEGGIQVAADPAEVGTALEQLCDDPAARGLQREAARQALRPHTGAMARTLAIVGGLLPR